MDVEPARRETGSPAAWLVWGLRAVFVTLLIVGWLGPWSGPTSLLWTLGNIGVAIAASLAADLTPAKRPHLLKHAEAVLYAILAFNLMGGAAFALYRRVPPFDLALHFFAGGLLVYFLYALAAALPAPALWRWGTPLQTAVFAFAASLALGGLWEIFEGTVTFLVPNTQPIHNFYGTVQDLMADAAGALVGAAIAARAAAHRRSSPPSADRRARKATD